MTNIFLTGSICLSDIPAEFIKTGNNGKKYLQVVISANKVPGRFGDTHNMKVSLTKDQRAQGKEIYIGNFKEYGSQQPQGQTQYPQYAQQPQYQNPSQPVNSYGEPMGNDLPF